MRVEKKKNQSGSVAAIVVVSAVLLFAGFFAFGGTGSKNAITGTATFDTDTLAQCIIDSGAIFYGTEWCSHCKNQKELLGDTYNTYKTQFYVDCDKEPNKCSDAGIRGYPTWIIDGQKYEGVQQIDRLANLLSCNI